MYYSPNPGSLSSNILAGESSWTPYIQAETMAKQWEGGAESYDEHTRALRYSSCVATPPLRWAEGRVGWEESRGVEVEEEVEDEEEEEGEGEGERKKERGRGRSIEGGEQTEGGKKG